MENQKKQVGFVCFGEVNTPYERLQIKHDQALQTLQGLDMDCLDGGIVLDDPGYSTADAAIGKLKKREMCCLIVCVAGWIPSHAVIRVTDVFRHTPMILWGLCGWMEGTRIVTTADQAGTTALRPAFEAMGYAFQYIYNVMGEPQPVERIQAFVNAAYAVQELRKVRIGTMGYRDMLLYGTQYEGNSLRAELGVEVEPFEMLEMVQNTQQLSQEKIQEWSAYVRENWIFDKECEEELVNTGVRYGLAIGKKIEERGYHVVSLIDVDGMKKLLGFPPAMIFMLLNHFYGVQVVPENDIMGAVTQSILSLLTGQTVPYLEYYEFFKESMLIGVPDFIPEAATEGEIRVLPTAFGLLNASLLNVSKVKTGYVTCARLIYQKGKYKMHVYTGEAKRPPAWEECGWEPPAPQLPSLEVFPDSCTVEEFSRKVSSQHVIVAYGDHRQTLEDFCGLLHIEVL